MPHTPSLQRLPTAHKTIEWKGEMNFKTSRYFQTRGYNCRVTYTDDESTIGKLF